MDDVIRQAELVAIDAELAHNQLEIDFAVAVIARGGQDAYAMREQLTRLETERGDLLDQRDEIGRDGAGCETSQ